MLLNKTHIEAKTFVRTNLVIASQALAKQFSDCSLEEDNLMKASKNYLVTNSSPAIVL